MLCSQNSNDFSFCSVKKWQRSREGESVSTKRFTILWGVITASHPSNSILPLDKYHHRTFIYESDFWQEARVNSVIGSEWSIDFPATKEQTTSINVFLFCMTRRVEVRWGFSEVPSCWKRVKRKTHYSRDLDKGFFPLDGSYIQIR